MTWTQYLELMGLCAILKMNRQALDRTEAALVERLGLDERDADHVYDASCSDDPISHLVTALELEVPKPPT